MREVGARYARVILLTRFGHSSEAWSSVIVIKSLGSPMGRGQLKYRRRGRGKGGGGRSGGNGPDDSVGIKEAPSRRQSAAGRDTAHLPPNTEMWGGIHDTEGRGRVHGSSVASRAALGRSKETERLFDESAWAEAPSFVPQSGLDSGGDDYRDDEFRRLALPGNGDPFAAATTDNFLSLDLGALATCLHKAPAHERLRMPLAYTSNIDCRTDPALEPSIVFAETPTSALDGRYSLRDTAGGGPATYESRATFRRPVAGERAPQISRVGGFSERREFLDRAGATAVKQTAPLPRAHNLRSDSDKTIGEEENRSRASTPAPAPSPAPSAMTNDGVLDALLGLTVTDAFSAVAAPLDVPGVADVRAGGGSGGSGNLGGGRGTKKCPGVIGGAVYSGGNQRSSSIDGARMIRNDIVRDGRQEAGRRGSGRTDRGASTDSSAIAASELESWLDDVLAES